MNVVLNSTDSIGIASVTSAKAREVGMKLRLNGLRDEGGPIFGAENEVDDDAIKGLRHCLLSSNVVIDRPYRLSQFMIETQGACPGLV